MKRGMKMFRNENDRRPGIIEQPHKTGGHCTLASEVIRSQEHFLENKRPPLHLLGFNEYL